MLAQGRPLRTANSRALRTTLAELQALQAPHPFTAGWRSVPSGEVGPLTDPYEVPAEDPAEDPAQCKKKDDDKKGSPRPTR